jgi:hypothetical protein
MLVRYRAALRPEMGCKLMHFNTNQLLKKHLISILKTGFLAEILTTAPSGITATMNWFFKFHLKTKPM